MTTLERAIAGESSPQAWGCFHGREVDDVRPSIFPTGVGVFLVESVALLFMTDLPHRRGGVSGVKLGGRAGEVSSPQAWGCFSSVLPSTVPVEIFPTGVGVFLR